MTQGKWKHPTFKPIDYVIVKGMKLKQYTHFICDVLEWLGNNTTDYYRIIKTMIFEDIVGFLSPLLLDTTPRWTENIVQIDDKDSKVVFNVLIRVHYQINHVVLK